MTIAWPESLLREIAERRVVFFVGSGLSKAAHHPFPTWAELLLELAKGLHKRKDQTLIATLLKQGRMLDAAQVITDGVPKADLNTKMRQIFQVRPTPHHDLYKHLLNMDPKTIVTTNYDEFLEKNFEHFSAGQEAHSISRHNSKNLLTDLRSPIRSIVKIHGCITDPSDLVLDRASFFKAKENNPGIFQTVSALMMVNTVVFLGYSVGDPDIQLILENTNMHTKSSHPHYALMQKFEHISIRNSLTETYNISYLEYATGGHGQVPDLIADLAKGVGDLRGARGIV